MKCPNCQNSSTIKKGIRNGHQRRYCSSCCRYFQTSYTYRAYRSSCNENIISLLKEGVGIRSISRIMQISKTTVLQRIRTMAERIELAPEKRRVHTIEVDELWTYIGHKKCFTWVTYGIDRASRKVLALHVGRRTSVALGAFIDQLMRYRPTRIYTDRLNVYPRLIPGSIHRTSPYGTNRIERYNLTLRTHVKRLARRTICFSKCSAMLTSHLKLYFWHPAYPDSAHRKQ